MTEILITIGLVALALVGAGVCIGTIADAAGVK